MRESRDCVEGSGERECVWCAVCVCVGRVVRSVWRDVRERFVSPKSRDLKANVVHVCYGPTFSQVGTMAASRKLAATEIRGADSGPHDGIPRTAWGTEPGKSHIVPPTGRTA